MLTSSVMHAVTLSKLVPLISQFKSQKSSLSLVDIGCGTGYSTLLYADLASQIYNSRRGQNAGMDIRVLGIDIYERFIEKASILKGKYAGEMDQQGLDIQFKLHDFVTKEIEDKFNMATFGFQVNSEMLHQK